MGIHLLACICAIALFSTFYLHLTVYGLRPLSIPCFMILVALVMVIAAGQSSWDEARTFLTITFVLFLVSTTVFGIYHLVAYFRNDQQGPSFQRD